MTRRPATATEAAEHPAEELAGFLMDIEAALGLAYLDPERSHFKYFGLPVYPDSSSEQPLAERLAQAFQVLSTPAKRAARRLAAEALEWCAKSPQGIKRSLVCVDLVHAIHPAYRCDTVYAGLLRRPTEAAHRASLLQQLLWRWRKWNVQVKLSHDAWRRAVREIGPAGLFELVNYFEEQLADEYPALWSEIGNTALRRVLQNKAELMDFGLDPEDVADQIQAALRDSDATIEAPAAAGSALHRDKVGLRENTRVQVQGLPASQQKQEAQAWELADAPGL